MSALLAPAYFLISRLSFAAKISLIIILFLIPVAYLSGLQFVASQKHAALMRLEAKGFDYLTTVRHLYAVVPQHRGLSQAVLKGKSDVKPRLDAVATEVEKQFVALQAIDTELGESLKTGSTVASLHNDWTALRRRNSSLAPKDSFAQHTALIERIGNLMRHVNVQSGLGRDSDDATGYGARVLTEQVPTLAEFLGRTRGLGSGIAAAGTMDIELRSLLATNLAFVRESAKQLDAVTDQVKSAAPEIAAKIDSRLHAADEASRDFIELIDTQVLHTPEITVDASKVFDSGTKAISAVFAFYDTLTPVLIERLATRTARDESRLYATAGIALGTLLLLIYFVIAFYRVVIDSIKRLAKGTEEIATGNLGVRIQLGVKDELATIEVAVNHLAEQFGNLIRGVQEAGEAVTQAAGNMTSITATTRSSMSSQQTQVSQVATAVNEMTATVQEVAQSAARTADATREAKQQVDAGQAIVVQSRSSTQGLAQEVERASGVINELESNSNEIGGVLDVIRGIAEQTNLLALNAAIEAARAGEQGRGFAVVADEVRTLAGRTQQSTSEIQDMIERLQQGARQAVHVMRESRDQAEASLSQSENASIALERITQAISHISDMSSQIATAAEEQSATTEEINQSVVNIDKTSHSTFESTSEADKASQQLQDLAENLLAETSKFRC